LRQQFSSSYGKAKKQKSKKKKKPINRMAKTIPIVKLYHRAIVIKPT
jgi:hypothetical protein